MATTDVSMLGVGVTKSHVLYCPLAACARTLFPVTSVVTRELQFFQTIPTTHNCRPAGAGHHQL